MPVRSRTVWTATLFAASSLILAACTGETAPPVSPPPASPVPTNTPLPTTAPTDSPPPASPTSAPVPTLAPLPAGQAVLVTEIRMMDASRGWALGGLRDPGDHVLRTEDGGRTWRDVTPPQPLPPPDAAPLQAQAFFLDADRAWASYGTDQFPPPSEALVWRTQDGGASWTASAASDLEAMGAEFYHPLLTFANGQHGWLLAGVGAGMSHVYAALLRTADGGATWETLIEPAGAYLQACPKTGMVFADADTGWVTRDCRGLIEGVPLDVTHDGGQTWEALPLPPPPDSPDLFGPEAFCGLFDPHLFSPTSGAVVVRCDLDTGGTLESRNLLYRTEDGGATWSVFDLPAESVQFLEPNLVWGLGNEIYLSRDGGRTWEFVKEVTWEGQFSFVSERLGWAVARAEGAVALVATTDGARTWSELSPTIGP